MDPCEGMIPLIVRAAEGTLDPGDRATLDAHVEGCAACRAALADQQAVRHVLAAAPLPEPSPWFAARVRARIDEAGGAENWLDLFDWRAWTLRLAPLAALLALVAWLPSGSSSSALPSVPTAIEAWAGGGASAEETDPGALLLDPATDRHALLAAALEETLR